ncbi:5032_t:CDS:2, partial [Racocetra fulgida]
LELVTDYQALKWLLNNPQPTSRLARWIMIAAEYPCTIRYKKGQQKKFKKQAAHYFLDKKLLYRKNKVIDGPPLRVIQKDELEK